MFARRIRSPWDFGDGRDVFISMVSNTSHLLRKIRVYFLEGKCIQLVFSNGGTISTTKIHYNDMNEVM